MGKNLTTIEFVRKSKIVHGNRYDYSKVEYIDCKTPVCIICSKHGEFWQTPRTHLKGSNCPKCATEKKTTKRLVTCDNCKKEFLRHVCYDKRNNKHIFCCKKCESDFRRLNNTMHEWEGGHIGKTTGYKYIRINGKDIGEHDLVMMKNLCRPLEKHEVVHHIDGDKLNNSLDNLQLMSRKEHVKLHNNKRKTVKRCARCGDVKAIHGRGLCARCYVYCLRNKKLNEYELSKKSKRK